MLNFSARRIHLLYVCLVASTVTGDKVRDDTLFHVFYININASVQKLPAMMTTTATTTTTIAVAQ